jgi:RNA polymerase sigma-70 factor (ECF subfamily)
MRGLQDQRYAEAADRYGGALQRLVRAWEADPERRRDLLQEVQFALWRSFQAFDDRCSLRTWVYRVAHNVAASHVRKARGEPRGFIGLDELGDLPDADTPDLEARDALARLYAVIHRLKPPDRQVMTLYLEGLDARAIAEVTGLSPGAVATRVSRVKTLLARTLRPEAAHV